MKQTLLSLIFCCSLNAFSQNYQLLPDSCTFCMYLFTMGGTTWYDGMYNLDPDDSVVMMGQTYMKLNNGDIDQPIGFRQEGNKLYGFVADSNHEELIMDFDLQVGDTAFGLYSEGMLFDAVVQEKDSFLLSSGDYHTRMGLYGIRYFWMGEWNEATWFFDWNEKGLCAAGGVVFNVAEITPVLAAVYAYANYCTTDLDYGAGDTDVSCENCVPWTSSLDEYERINLNIAPNPVNDRLSLELDKPVDLVRIMDINGALLSEVQNSNTTIELNLEELKAGIYFVVVQSGNSLARRRFVKI